MSCDHKVICFQLGFGSSQYCSELKSTFNMPYYIKTYHNIPYSTTVYLVVLGFRGGCTLEDKSGTVLTAIRSFLLGILK